MILSFSKLCVIGNAENCLHYHRGGNWSSEMLNLRSNRVGHESKFSAVMLLNISHCTRWFSEDVVTHIKKVHRYLDSKCWMIFPVECNHQSPFLSWVIDMGNISNLVFLTQLYKIWICLRGISLFEFQINFTCLFYT